MTHALIEQSKLLSKPDDPKCDKTSMAENFSLMHRDDTIDEFISTEPPFQNHNNNDPSENIQVDIEEETDNQSDEFFDCSSQNQVEFHSTTDDFETTHADSYLDNSNGIYSDDYLSEHNKHNDKDIKNYKPLRHLFPNVVVNTSTEGSDIDSDEEDYRLRMSRNDSGQGSSVETSSIKSNPTETYSYIDNNKQMHHNHTDSALHDIDLSSDESSLPLHRTSSLLKHYNTQQESNKNKLYDNSNFTDIDLNAPSSPKNLNTFTPSKHSHAVDETDHDRRFKLPKVTDIPSKTNLVTRTNSQQQRAWKVFGKVAVSIPKEPSPKTSPRSIRKYKKDTVASSTTALILENRPSNLPPKSVKEERKHREQYEEMIALAKRKELRDLENEKKKLKQRRKLEDQLSNTVKVWKEEITPNWDVCKNTKKVRDLWWLGVPPSVRGLVWKLAIGNDLHMTAELFQIFQEHAQERIRNKKNIEPPKESHHDSENSLIVSKENAVGLITLDVSRTFPALCIFQKGGPYHEPLKTLLLAYTCHRPDVGYVQGMSFLAAMLLLNLDLTDAFIAFSNLLSRSCQMAFFMVDQAMMDAYFRTFDVLLEEQIPRLHVHFKKESLSHDIYLIDWIFTVFSKSLPLDTACRVWDLFLRDGEEFLFRTALGILLMHQDALLEMEFFRLAQYLTKLSNTITADQLFSYIEKINFTKQKYQQTLTTFKEMVRPRLH